MKKKSANREKNENSNKITLIKIIAFIITYVVPIVSLIVTSYLSIYSTKYSENLKEEKSASMLYMDIDNTVLAANTQLQLYESKVIDINDPDNVNHVKVGMMQSGFNLINNYSEYISDLATRLNKDDLNNINCIYECFNTVAKDKTDYENEKDSKLKYDKQKFYYESLVSLKSILSSEENRKSVENLRRVANIPLSQRVNWMD